MITTQNSWSLGVTPNKSPEPFGPFICSHSQGDLTAAFNRPLTSCRRTAYQNDRPQPSASDRAHPIRYAFRLRPLALPLSVYSAYSVVPSFVSAVPTPEFTTPLASTCNNQLCPNSLRSTPVQEHFHKHNQSTKKHIEFVSLTAPRSRILIPKSEKSCSYSPKTCSYLQITLMEFSVVPQFEKSGD